MKKYIGITVGLVTSVLQAQLLIGTEVSKSQASLIEFSYDSNNTRGIILPAVEQTPTLDPTYNNGTFLFDKKSNQVKMFENGVWVSLTDEGDPKAFTEEGRSSNLSREKGGGVVIGEEDLGTSRIQGVLIFEARNKAIVLPHIEDPHLNVKSPFPGMMCFDTNSNSLAVFDGKNWSYWK